MQSENEEDPAYGNFVVAPRRAVQGARDNEATLKRRPSTSLELHDVLHHEVKVVELADCEEDTVGVEAVLQNQLLLFLPKRLEDDVEEKRAVEFVKVFAQKVEKLGSRTPFVAVVNPVERQDSNEHLMSDFFVGLMPLEANELSLF